MFVTLFASNCTVDSNIKSAKQFIATGDRAFTEGNYDEAIKNYSFAIDHDPNDIQIYILRANVYSHRNNFDNALKDCQTALTIDPGYSKLYGMIATMHYEMGDIESALNEINRGIELDKDQPVLYLIRGLIFNEIGDCVNAIENFSIAMSYDPETFNTKTNIAWVLATCPDQGVRNGMKALKLAEEGIAEDPTHGNYNTLAAAYAETDSFDKAIIMQEKALELLQSQKAWSLWMQKNKDSDYKSYTEQLRSYQNNKKWRFVQSQN